VDNFALVAAARKHYRDLLEILDDRHGQEATLITSQLPVRRWHEIINDAIVADAILDRLAHNAWRLDAALRVSFQDLSVLELTVPDTTIKFGP
jgi:DNA replication protein DnaC